MRRSLLAFALLASALPGWAAKPPRWISGADPAYPDGTFIVGVGIGGDLDGARANARAEISRAFQARVQQTVTDTQTETSASVGRRHGPAAGTQKSEMTTQVATDSLLEGVQIKETWFDKKKKKYYALAALDKRAARMALTQQIVDKEEGIGTRLAQEEDAETELSRAKALGQALTLAQERDALVARRRVVDPAPIPDMAGETSTAKIDGALAKILSGITFHVKADGGEKSRLKQAVEGRIAGMGFKLTDREDAPLVVTCTMTVEPFDRGHPQWKFYRWSGVVEMFENGKTVASSTPSGEEGHLTEKTAETKARDAGEEGMAAEAQKLISQYVFGE
jgi:hypothetical protein